MYDEQNIKHHEQIDQHHGTFDCIWDLQWKEGKRKIIINTE